MKWEDVGAKKPARSVVRTIRTLCKLVDESGEPYRDLAKRAGISYPSISKWKHGRASPSIQSVENLLQVLGYELQIVKVSDPSEPR